MTLERTKLDVTDRLIGKLESGRIVLYLEKEKVGEIPFPAQPGISLQNHFEMNGEKVYQRISVPSSPQPRYTDCDEGGWC
ncbi:YusG family protein [Bacillus massilinigeriensis]|uniref:YusG family protein n=1 Tax=Bacillus mediterraneensis TaxID=1805474 RepID=UPI0008F84119|nr:YusG family protein [Bacillus mediterraneensis]